MSETTLLISFATFFFTGYQNLVTKDELQILLPYPYDKPYIMAHISESESALSKVNELLHQLNERISQVNFEHTLRINKLEYRQNTLLNQETE